MRSFEQFIQNDVQQRADRAFAKTQARKAAWEALRIPLSGSLLRETGLRGTPDGQATKTFIVAARRRLRYLLRRAQESGASPPSALPSRPKLAAIQESLAEEIQRLYGAARADERRNMEEEFADLDDRIKMNPLKSILHREVRRLAYLAAIERARNDCDTTRITRKGGEVAQVVVTARMRSAFASNLTQLGFFSAPVELKLGPGTVGQHPYYLSLIAREDVRPSEVLSEGEKTCVALAGFLAELETTNNFSGVVLDDPVSSLRPQLPRASSQALSRGREAEAGYSFYARYRLSLAYDICPESRRPDQGDEFE